MKDYTLMLLGLLLLVAVLCSCNTPVKVKFTDDGSITSIRSTDETLRVKDTIIIHHYNNSDQDIDHIRKAVVLQIGDGK